jgi:hypothetical protein
VLSVVIRYMIEHGTSRAVDGLPIERSGMMCYDINITPWLLNLSKRGFTGVNSRLPVRMARLSFVSTLRR